ncbi:MAG: bifunctional 2-polyprenyl-6-hydroxyphenol methylase/3-demethylubiquinol 3-O-methyltransferase UbiG [Magnetococcales bacterium]|nr:bifunctional 2-polyprenyl-6-hydroxyphenol methylase/3-demethylubiquinol 3-O-methyltransferase UbiG [Magnetococcales bacterium]
MSTDDPSEISKFDAMAHEWWDPDGRFKPLHRINPPRTRYIEEQLAHNGFPDMSKLHLLDIGCGGGILAEGLDQLGASVVAIDRSDKIIGVAKAHQKESGSRVDYRLQSAGELARIAPASFDAVMAMEVLEHVSDPPKFLRECALLLKPGGLLFFSTLNRTLQAWLLAIAGAEYVLRWLPRGTHDYSRFIRPSELSNWLRPVGIRVQDIAGLSYTPWRDQWEITRDPSVNYLGFGVLTPGSVSR